MTPGQPHAGGSQALSVLTENTDFLPKGTAHRCWVTAPFQAPERRNKNLLGAQVAARPPLASRLPHTSGGGGTALRVLPLTALSSRPFRTPASSRQLSSVTTAEPLERESRRRTLWESLNRGAAPEGGWGACGMGEKQTQLPRAINILQPCHPHVRRGARLLMTKVNSHQL